MFLKSLLSNLYSPMEGSGKLFGPVTGMLHSLQSYQLVLVSKRTASFVRLRIPPQLRQEGGGGKGKGIGWGGLSAGPPPLLHMAPGILSDSHLAQASQAPHTHRHTTHTTGCVNLYWERKQGHRLFLLLLLWLLSPGNPGKNN